MFGETLQSFPRMTELLKTYLRTDKKKHKLTFSMEQIEQFLKLKTRGCSVRAYATVSVATAWQSLPGGLHEANREKGLAPVQFGLSRSTVAKINILLQAQAWRLQQNVMQVTTFLLRSVPRVAFTPPSKLEGGAKWMATKFYTALSAYSGWSSSRRCMDTDITQNATTGSSMFTSHTE